MEITINHLLGALSEPTRLRTLEMLWDGDEHCVCELVERLGVTQSRMSRHLGRLKSAGLLVDRRDAQWVRYRRRPDIPGDRVAIIDAVLAALPPFAAAHRQQESA